MSNVNRKIEDKIKEKQAEILKLNSLIDETKEKLKQLETSKRSYEVSIECWEDVKKIVNKKYYPRGPLRKIQKLLTEENKPLLITEILERLKIPSDDLKMKHNLTSQLNKYVSSGVIFTRPEPSTYFLL